MMFQYAIDSVKPEVVAELREQADACEQLREKATYKTGTISLAAAVYLRTLTERYQPKILVEIGTFIGTSTLAMKAEQIFTCDYNNDCLRSTPSIWCFPKHLSTSMLGYLVEKAMKVDFFFFDGRIQGPDLALILRLSHPMTIYAFDDYEKKEKGVVNVAMLLPYLRGYTFVAPPAKIGDLDSTTSIALLVPKELV